MIQTHNNLDTAMNHIKLHPHNMRALMVNEAKRWVGVMEQDENNKGQLVEMFHSAAYLSPGDPWCAAFIWYLIQQTEKQAIALDMNAPRSKLYLSGHVQTMWSKSPKEKRITAAQAGAGDLMLWNKQGTTSGHIEMILEPNYTGSFTTIGGNTAPTNAVERDGEGVFVRNRLVGGYGNMIVTGFLRVW